MLAKLERSGISFQYPQNWAFEIDDDNTDWVATLQTPGTAVMVLTYRADTAPDELGDESIEALRSDYPDLDSEVVVERLGGQTAIGYDIDFLTLDTPVLAKIRAFDTPQGAFLVFWQVADKERSHYESLFDAIANSIRIQS